MLTLLTITYIYHGSALGCRAGKQKRICFASHSPRAQTAFLFHTAFSCSSLPFIWEALTITCRQLVPDHSRGSTYLGLQKPPLFNLPPYISLPIMFMAFKIFSFPHRQRSLYFRLCHFFRSQTWLAHPRNLLILIFLWLATDLALSHQSWFLPSRQTVMSPLFWPLEQSYNRPHPSYKLLDQHDSLQL